MKPGMHLKLEKKSSKKDILHGSVLIEESDLKLNLVYQKRKKIRIQMKSELINTSSDKWIKIETWIRRK